MMGFILYDLTQSSSSLAHWFSTDTLASREAYAIVGFQTPYTIYHEL